MEIENEIIEEINLDKIDLTWFEIQVTKRSKSNKIIGKSLLICQGNNKSPSLIFLSKNDAENMIKELEKVVDKL